MKEVNVINIFKHQSLLCHLSIKSQVQYLCFIINKNMYQENEKCEIIK